MYKYLALFFCLLLSSVALAIDCERPISRIYVGDDGRKHIYIDHGDGYEASRMQPSYVSNSEEIMDRSLSLLLSAKLSGNKTVFRYLEAEDGSAATCTPNKSQKLSGVWIKFD